jgi:heme-degrading monooxygenase HmoA
VGEFLSPAANLSEATAVIVVLFGSANRPDMDVEAHDATAARMAEIVSSIPGFISYNSYTSEEGDEMAVVRFDSLEALDAWRTQPEHLEAQEKDRALWSERYWIQVSSTVREYQWTRGVGYHDDLRAKFSAGSEIPSSPESSQVEPEA